MFKTGFLYVCECDLCVCVFVLCVCVSVICMHVSIDVCICVLHV